MARWQVSAMYVCGAIFFWAYWVNSGVGFTGGNLRAGAAFFVGAFSFKGVTARAARFFLERLEFSCLSILFGHVGGFNEMVSVAALN